MRRGFTLVEMMFVVVILGVLTTLAVWGFSRPLVATRGIEASTFLLQVRKAAIQLPAGMFGVMWTCAIA